MRKKEETENIENRKEVKTVKEMKGWKFKDQASGSKKLTPHSQIRGGGGGKNCLKSTTKGLRKMPSGKKVFENFPGENESEMIANKFNFIENISPISDSTTQTELRSKPKLCRDIVIIERNV